MQLLNLFCPSHLAKLLNTMVKIKLLAVSKKEKFFDSLVSSILSEHLVKLYKIDAEKGYDPSNIMCREIAV